jgi:hypothetical protein
MKTIILATAIVALATTSGQAFARTVPLTQQQAAAADERAYIDQRVYPYDAFDATVPQMTDVEAHRYHGGPKSND